MRQIKCLPMGLYYSSLLMKFNILENQKYQISHCTLSLCELSLDSTACMKKLVLNPVDTRQMEMDT